MVSTLFLDWLGTQVHLTAVDNVGKALRLVSGKQRSWFDSSLWHYLFLLLGCWAVVDGKVRDLISRGVSVWCL
jgi:hypothetical protein